MRFRNLRFRRTLATGAAALLAGVGAAVAGFAGAGPASAAEFCYNLNVTIIVNSSGNWIGTSGNDVVIISANNATYEPVGGHDSICIFASGGTTVFNSGAGHQISGGPGPDKIYGSSGDDHIGGGGGDDVLVGNGGNDRLSGSAGNDYIRGYAGDDVLQGGVGDDCILGGSGYNQLYGDQDSDVLLMGYDQRYNSTQCAPADWDFGPAAQAFRNNLSSGGEADGHSGTDRIWGSNGNDFINGGSGDDTVYSWAGVDSIWGDHGGESGSDSLHGGSGNDSLFGFEDGDDPDQLFGDGGSNDDLNGGANDVCYPDYGPATVPCD